MWGTGRPGSDRIQQPRILANYCNRGLSSLPSRTIPSGAPGRSDASLPGFSKLKSLGTRRVQNSTLRRSLGTTDLRSAFPLTEFFHPVGIDDTFTGLKTESRKWFTEFQLARENFFA